MFSFISILFITILMVVAVILLGRLATSGKQDTPEPKRMEAPKPKRMSWLWYFGITLFIALWTVIGALFFLAVVWVLRMDPSSDTFFTLTNNEKKTAQRIYTWLFFSPLITVPIFIGMMFNVSYSATTNEYVLAALIPLLVHIPLLFGLTSKSAFVYRHTQQGLLLIALRAGVASLVAINVEAHIDYALSLFFLGNGALWFFGSLAGWSQTSNGKCWFMDRKGETIILLETTEQLNPAQAQERLERSRKHLNSRQNLPALNNALSSFRHGNIKTRQEALKIIDALGEVEKF